MVQCRKGLGFIAPEGEGKDVFVHASALSRSGLSAVAEGQKVLFEQGLGKKAWKFRLFVLVKATPPYPTLISSRPAADAYCRGYMKASVAGIRRRLRKGGRQVRREAAPTLTMPTHS
ncbi:MULTISPECIES: cold shock domain-containing protein [Mesorhizobium]|uniref:cold-shock protein n=1 Tax=Mesorhizobium TaxID=68287 RepID=UPI002477FB39|nr:cold shock domain-containing protein [Mesorhizobium sp. WSM3873]